MMTQTETTKIRLADLPCAMRRLHRIEVSDRLNIGGLIPWVEPVWHEMLAHGRWVALDSITREIRENAPALPGCPPAREVLVRLAGLGWFDTRNPEQFEVKASVRLEFRARIAPRRLLYSERSEIDQFAGLVRAASVFDLARALHD
ncbi:MAG: hypothetical protein RLZZ373_3267 [Pseudomonadota bacterium]|jgi:hypothetical protein